MSPGSRLEFKVQGLDCAQEAAILKREVGPLVGGPDRLVFDLLNGKMSVQEGSQASPEAILAVVARAGMRAEPWREGSEGAPDASVRRHRVQLALLAASGGFLALGWAIHAWHGGGILRALAGHGIPWASRGAYLAGILCSLRFVAPKAWLSLRRLRPDMNLLEMVAVAGAVAIGEWFEAATVSFLFALSFVLEAWSIVRARRAVQTLLDLTPPVAHLKAGDQLLEVPAATVPVGGIFLVKPGERVPLDGEVLQGDSLVDQAPLTGESLPVSKGPGDELFGGSINGDGTLTVKSSRPASDTLLARMVRLVGEAQSRRAPSEVWVDRFARVYTPVVMAMALLVALAPLATGAPWLPWAYRALVLLVIACPCALVISTPVSVVAGLTMAARQGVLIKGGQFLEAPAHLKAMALDKTGTLTLGKPRVVGVFPAATMPEAQLVRVAAALESQSGHPLALAIVAHARSLGLAFGHAQDFRLLPGKGAEGTVDGRGYWLASHRHLEERGLETPALHELMERQEQQGRTLVALGSGADLLGFLALADTLRPEAPKVLRQLEQAGVERLVLLTGDNRGTARALAAQAGIRDFRAELLPEGKMEAVGELADAYGQVAMVGDGVNDAPAMARAGVAIAMGAFGSDAAIETADIALMDDDLTRLPWLIHHARRTRSTIRWNIAFALGVKAAFVALTLAGHASLWAAIVADMGASLVVIFNGLRLLKE